jgi:hypothetical protein
MQSYTHNFACWAAARAVQNPNNSGTSTGIIKDAVEKAGLEAFVENPKLLEDYPSIHDYLVKKLNKKLGWSIDQKYGVLAKIIAMYFKVAIILPNKASKKIMVQIYPPIDSHHLNTIGLRNLRWTNMNEKGFNQSIDALKRYCKQQSMDFTAFEGNHPLV